MRILRSGDTGEIRRNFWEMGNSEVAYDSNRVVLGLEMVGIERAICWYNSRIGTIKSGGAINVSLLQ
jgi:hypothetical protein